MVKFNTPGRSLTLCMAFIILALWHPVRGSAQICCGDGEHPEQQTSIGTEFLLCFEQNYQPNFLDDPYLEIYLASTQDTATVYITCNQYPKLNRILHLDARKSFVYRISTDTIQYHGTTRLLDTLRNLWITSSEQPDNRVVQVRSTSPIACYGMNHKSMTTDAFLALPKQSSTTEYRIMSYPNSALNDPTSAMSTQFAVAAFEDGTTVTIVPSAPTLSGRHAGVPFTIDLNQGECVQVQTDAQVAGLDLTGSEVRANHPIAVYGSHSRAEVPFGFERADGQVSRDHLTEAMPPVSAWGKAFILNAIDIDNAGGKHPDGDVVRVLALNDNTTVTVDGVLWTTLARNKWQDMAIKRATAIEASGPVLVAEYCHSQSTAGEIGDPFMAIVPPVDQTYNDYTVFASTDPAYTLQKIIIATDRRAKVTSTSNDTSSIVFDNRQSLLSFFFQDVPTPVAGRQFAITELGVEPGVHTLRSNLPPDQGFTILMYGLGNVDSYGYTAGLLLKPQRALMASELPQIAGRHNTGEFEIRNITSEAVFVDSVRFTYNQDDGASRFTVTPRMPEDIWRIGVGGSESVTIGVDGVLDRRVRGTMHVYSHTPKWWRLEPLDVPFVLDPQPVAEVTPTANQTAGIRVYPDPMNSSSTISFTLPRAATVTLKVYDGLGRVVRVLMDGRYEAGSLEINFQSKDLPSGVYTLELGSVELGLRYRHSIVISR